MNHDRTSQIQLCLDRLRAGDAAARNRLLEGTGERLRRLARRMLGDYPRVRRWEETGDVLQNAELRLWNALRELRPATVADFLGLAALQIRRELRDLADHYYGPCGLGANYTSDVRGKSHRHPATETDETDRLLFWSEFHRQVELLPERERQAFDLLWYQELSQAEAATVLGVSEREVRRRWRSARQLLRQRLPGDWPEG